MSLALALVAVTTSTAVARALLLNMLSEDRARLDAAQSLPEIKAAQR